MSNKSVDEFIEDWRESGANEESNRIPFLRELCEVLGVDKPNPAKADTKANDYVFERHVDHQTSSDWEWGSIDLYKKGCFVLEAKQGSDAPVESEAERLGVHEAKRSRGTARRGTPSWDDAMRSAKRQAKRYAKGLPESDGWPPFLVVVDVGHCFDLYADFARQGKNYVPFPNQEAYRIEFEELTDPDVRDTLHRVWTDPMSLDPTRASTKITKNLAESLGRVAASLEDDGHDPDHVAGFLMRCLFAMFAEDVELLPERSFTEMLVDCRDNLEAFPKVLKSLWETMDTGGFHPGLKEDVRQFNGHLFENQSALPVSEAQLELLIEAAEADWSNVEPAIFGTLLERALDPRERSKLGAHFTPRAYVERLVAPTVIEPLREEWNAAQTAAAKREADGDEEAARDELIDFHHRLCTLKVLDPACGSGNFLYVTLEHLKRLEAEVLDVLADYGWKPLDMTGGERVSPGQLMGLEINPRAAAITDVVLWIGYLQWHFQTYGDANRLDPPLLQDIDNIQTRDAVLSYDEKHPRTNKDGEPKTMWDNRTYKRDPSTDKLVPDKSAQVPVYDYENPKPADWPEADFIVGNPPFVGNKRMREELGKGYVEALRDSYAYKVRKDADYVMIWWYKAAKAVRKGLDGWDGAAVRFGLISTNSIGQISNRKLIRQQTEDRSPPLQLAFAIPDHPWVDSNDGSDVRISMTVGSEDADEGTLQKVISEEQSSGIHWDVEVSEETGQIQPDLTIGPNVAGAEPLQANADLSYMGVIPVGDPDGEGFRVNPEGVPDLGYDPSSLPSVIRPYLNGTDVSDNRPLRYIIDFFGFDRDQARSEYPGLYQRVQDRVKPHRDEANRKNHRKYWWVFGEARPGMRDALSALDRYLVTVETAKHHYFTFLPKKILPDQKLRVVASDDAYHLGVLSSSIHEVWALAAGGRQGVGNDPVYNHTKCFDPFPFPDPSDSEKNTIRDLSEELYRRRRGQLDEHRDLTMTGLYNVLKKERNDEDLDADEREIHEKGLVGVLSELHDELDVAVARAYGWEPGLEKEEILQRLVNLNAKRRAEEEQGQVRYLRPEYQAPEAVQKQGELEIDIEDSSETTSVEPLEWVNAELKSRAQAVRTIVNQSEEPLTVEQVAQHFHRARRDDVRDLLETLTSLGLVDREGDSFLA